MSGTGAITVVGLGPGGPGMLTPDATQALREATDLIGYGPYLDRVGARPDQRLHPSDNRAEVQRARDAFALAIAGARVVVVSGGDPGVFGMAAAVFEALEEGPPVWRRVPVTVIPGVSAMLAAAAAVGAPLGQDFCAISLSDNLKPWELVLSRLDAAGQGDFVLTLYNPSSAARPWQLAAALDRLRSWRPASTPVVFANAIGRADEAVIVTNLGEADAAQADMRTLVIVGSSSTRLVARGDGLRPYVYSPRKAMAGTVS